MQDFVLVHTPDYGNWSLGTTHPTQGRRYINAFNLLMQTAKDENYTFDIVEPRRASFSELLEVHDLQHVVSVDDGFSDEWSDQNPVLGDLAFRLAGGTINAMDELVAKRTLTAINFTGAKHHAQESYSSGFCVFADFALTANILTEFGYRVAILDIDAHHGDGTENLTLMNEMVLTFSIHEWGIFPLTGDKDYPEFSAYNEPLSQYAGDRELFDGVNRFIKLAKQFGADFILIAGGADGHVTDPLSSLMYTLNGVHHATSLVRFAFPDTPILFGGAGGYQPDTNTPLMWLNMVKGLISPVTYEEAIDAVLND